MHELSIAQSIVDTVLAAAAERPGSSVANIHLKIGALSDIARDALEFGFEAITRGTELEETLLEIEIVPIIARCERCHTEFEIHEYSFQCPDCGSRDVAMTQGAELDIDSITLTDPGPTPICSRESTHAHD